MDHLLGPRHRQALALLSARSRDQIYRYLILLHSRNYARGTLAALAGAVIRLIRSLPIERRDLVRRSFARVTAADIDSLIETTRRQNLSPGTINLTIDLLRGFFRFLCEEGQMSAQPVLKHRHSILVPMTLPKPMNETDLAAFFRVIDSIRDRLIFLLMLRCGLRISEVCRLTWTRVDLCQGTLLICDGKGRVSALLNNGKRFSFEINFSQVKTPDCSSSHSGFNQRVDDGAISMRSISFSLWPLPFPFSKTPIF
jgi:site-specific recombinase XerD